MDSFIILQATVGFLIPWIFLSSHPPGHSRIRIHLDSSHKTTKNNISRIHCCTIRSNFRVACSGQRVMIPYFHHSLEAFQQPPTSIHDQTQSGAIPWRPFFYSVLSEIPNVLSVLSLGAAPHGEATQPVAAPC